MAARLLMADGRDVIIALSGKRAAEALVGALNDGGAPVRLTTPTGGRVWINPAQVAAIEDVDER